MAKVAIVILNWNGQKMLAKYLPNVLEYSRQDAEVWVADNCSTDQSMHLLETQFPQVKTIVLEQNFGFAEGYNRALSQIEAEYYVLLNSDVEVSHHWLTPLIEFMDSHEQVAACQPKLLAEYDKDSFEYAGACGGFLDKYGYPFCRGRIFDTVERDDGQYDYQQEILWATGACMMIRSKAYWDADGLDGRFFAHNEEIDLCWRLRLKGRKIYCIPESEVYHVGGGTLPKSNPMKTYLNFRNNLTMLYKNLPDSDLKHVMRIRYFLDYLAAFEMLILKRNWGDFKAIFKARRAFKAWRSDFDEDRRKIQEGRVKERIPQVFDCSILWQYYAKGKKFFSQLMLALVSLVALTAQAQANFNVTVSNPSKSAKNNEPVVIGISKYGDIQRAVVSVDGKEIPSQLDDTNRDCTNDELCFLVDLGKKETKDYHVQLFTDGKQADYPARTFAELCLPSKNKKLAKNKQDIYLRSISFDKKTKDVYHYVHSHGVCFESDLVAMRVYFDNRQTIDLYGKVNKGLVIQDTQFYPSEEQLKAGSGDDCLWVGNTYGLGALRGWDGKNQLLLDDVTYQEQRVVSEGPLRAIVEVVDNGWVPAPGLKPVNATIRYTIYAGHRDFDVDVTFNKDVSDYRFATGLINVKGSSEYADGKGLRGCYGSDWPTGKDDGKHKLETVGLGIYVPQAALVSQEPANKDDYTQVVKPTGNKLNYKLAYTSANEIYGFKGEKEWYQWLRDWKKSIEEPLKVYYLIK